MSEHHHESKAHQAHQVLENFIKGNIDQTSAVAELNSLYPELTTSFTAVAEGDGGPLEDLLCNANSTTPIDDLELGILELRRQAHAKTHTPTPVRAGQHKAAALVTGLLMATLGEELARTDLATAQGEHSAHMDIIRGEVANVLADPRTSKKHGVDVARAFAPRLNGTETLESAENIRVILNDQLKKIDPSINIATLQDEISLRSYLTSGLKAVLKNDALMAIHAGLITLSALFAATLYLHRSSPESTPAGEAELFASFVELLHNELYSIAPKRISKLAKQIYAEATSPEEALKTLFPSTDPDQTTKIQENDTHLETILDSRKSRLTKGLETSWSWAQSLFTRKTPAITDTETREEDEPTDKIPAPKTLSSKKRFFYTILTGLGLGGAVVNEVRAISETHESVNVRGAKVTATDLTLASHHLVNAAAGITGAIFLRGLLKENSEKKVELFEKLFPKSLLGFGARKLDIQQGESGTCYFLSALIVIWEKDQSLFKMMIDDLIKETEDPDVVAITFPSDSKGNPISDTYKVCLDPNRVCEGDLLSINRLANITDDQGNDISRALTKAPLGVKALEAAIASHMSRVEQGRVAGMTMRVAPDRSHLEMDNPTPVDGGFPEEVFQILLGKAIEKREYKETASYNLADLNAANILAVAGTLSKKRANEDQKRAMRALGLHTSHAYAVKSYDAEAHTVNLINPHNSTQSIVISEDNFKKYFSHIFEGTLTPKD